MRINSETATADLGGEWADFKGIVFYVVNVEIKQH